jgi:hypothetical protein
MNQRGKAVEGPAVWTGDELERDTDWIVTVDAQDIEDIEAALAGARRRGDGLLALSPEKFPLPRLSRKLAAIATELESGRGIVQMRGLPVEQLSADERKAMIWGIGTYLGVGLSQSKLGDYLGEVTDLDVQMGAADGRGYRSKGLSRFHFDRCDVVGLLCIRRAKEGGESRVVSSAAVHNEILRRRPDLLEVLYQDFYHSRQGEEAPGEKPYFKLPMFSIHEGFFSAQLSFLYIESAQRFPEVPRLTPQQQEALALVSEVCDALYVESPFLPGDLQLLNNHVTWHCRAGYEDHAEAERRRLLYRLWLSTPGSRPLPESYRDSWGATEPGVLRGGVPSAEGWRDVAALASHQQAIASSASSAAPASSTTAS